MPDIEGIVVVEVDDVMDAGAPRHQAMMTKLREMRNFGKVKRLRDKEFIVEGGNVQWQALHSGRGFQHPH